MAVLSIVFGVLLTVLGGGVYAASVIEHMPSYPEINPWTKPLTALIPAAFGLGLIVCGILTHNSNSQRTRMHVMHAAALLGVIGCILPLVVLGIRLAKGGPWSPALTEMAAMAAIDALFVALCVKSFIEVRRARKAAEAAEIK